MKSNPPMAAVTMLFSSEFWRMAVLWTLSLLYSYFLLIVGHSLPFSRHRQPPHPPHLPRCKPPPLLLETGEQALPVCVITGATSGLGAAAAKELSWKGYYVVLAGRSLQLLSQTMKEIKQQNSCAQLQAFQVDLSSIDSVVEFKSKFQDWLLNSNLHPSVQLLINNGGILAAASRVTTDGYDHMIETNYISAFSLTNLLLPLLKNSPVPSRVVNVTSFTHRCVSDAPTIADQNLRCLSRSGNYPLAHTYEYSKFWLLLFTYELHRKLCLMDLSQKVSVLAADPGVVETNIMRELPKYLSRFAFAVLRILHLLQSPEDGIASIVDAALAPPGTSGEYFFGGNGRTVRSSALSYSTKNAMDLWNSSIRLFQEAMSRPLVDYDNRTMTDFTDGGEMFLFQ